MLSLSPSRTSDFRFRPRMLGIDFEVRAKLEVVLEAGWATSRRHPEVLDEVTAAAAAAAEEDDVEVRPLPEVNCWRGTDELVLLREAILTTGH